MVISNLTLTRTAKTVTLAADISFRGKKTETAYLTTDIKFESCIANDATPFLAAVLLPCMKSGENIYVDDTVSKQFLTNATAIMKLVKRWNIGLNPVKIRVRSTVADLGKPKGNASFFTAGVDSFYTYLKHKTSRTPITHLVLAHGFDIPLSNKTFFNEVAKTVEKVAKEEKVEAVIIETNIGEIIEKRLVWDFAHGGALAAVALFLRRGLKNVFIAGAVRNDQLFPYGTHPHLDPLWSTETLTVKSDGGEYDRIGKIQHSIATSPLALKYLRVCTQNLKGKYNCSRCYKCLMTMMYLTAFDALKNAKTFERTINLDAVKRMYYDYKLKYNIQGERALATLKRQKKAPALQDAIAYSLEKSKHPKVLKRVAQKVATFDQKYNDRRLYRYVFKMNNDDRSGLFKILLKLGVMK